MSEIYRAGGLEVKDAPLSDVGGVGLRFKLAGEVVDVHRDDVADLHERLGEWLDWNGARA